jgi:ubiquinone/menaquinone biosynthesis C-methylase UbiE
MNPNDKPISETGQKPHSAEYFGEARDFWWNLDFIKLMGERLKLNQVTSVLDVGCGIGHWGRLLSSVLPSNVSLVGVDREPQWVTKATELAKQHGLENRFRYQVGDANLLEFPDHSFDMVTCQTVLIHLKSPKLALQEMIRVLKPGGLILLAEPNNFANQSIGSNLTFEQSIEEVIENIRFWLMMERGKQNLGLGNNSIGDLVPGFLAELNMKNIQVYLSDKATPTLPNRSGPEQKAILELNADWMNRECVGGHDYPEARSYFVAGGGDPSKFDQLWQWQLKESRDGLQKMMDGKLHTAGGGVFYLISAIK